MRNSFPVSACAARPAKNALTKTVRTGGIFDSDGGVRLPKVPVRGQPIQPIQVCHYYPF
ncbi:MAG: hypothetical protein MUO30_03025 [Anaerolineales bacterium]|nr:hypothetical protein [Anaerolineales bacterium]